jgi:citrate synthase
MSEPSYSRGLEGVVVGETAVSSIDDGMEQREHHRLIQPRSHYVGPEVRHVMPMSRRD